MNRGFAKRHQGLFFVLLGVGTAASDATEPAYWTGRSEQDTTWRDTVYVGGDVTIAAAATTPGGNLKGVYYALVTGWVGWVGVGLRVNKVDIARNHWVDNHCADT